MMTVDDVMAEVLAYGSLMAAYRGVSSAADDLHANIRARIIELMASPAEPVAWRVTDGEGSYDYADEPVSGFALELAARYGREYVPLYLHPPPKPQQAEPVPDAYIHKVRVCNGEPGETDYALSFSADSFPLGDAGLFESVDHRPLYRHPPPAELARLRAENERLRADAARWQHVRDVADPPWVVGLFERYDNDDIDAAIDAAMAQEKP